ncbi:MAG: diaminopimelate decarboxylase, partial [Verrucomicrobia bacterium]|nr:diaminopimelate decarboxylase [Verrucomicrobiota bacterium]
GLPVTYFEGESLDEEAYYAELSALFAEFFPHTHLTVEAGRGLAACCGTYLTRVVDVKENRGEKYAICDGGIHQLVYYGQMMAMKRPHLAHFPEREGVEENWNLCGSLCTVNDVLLKQLPVKDLQVGDTFAFFRTGAYSVTEGMALFLSRELPAVYLKDGEDLICLRERQETDGINGAAHL